MSNDIFCKSISETVLNVDWLKANEDSIKSIFPDTWTHIQNVNPVAIGFQLKLLGIDWRSTEQLSRVIDFFHAIGLLLHDGYTIKRNPHTIFRLH